MALTTLDSKKQLIPLPAFHVPNCGRMTHTISVQNALSVCHYSCMSALIAFGLQMHLFYVNTFHPPQVGMCVLLYLPNLLIIILLGTSMVVKYFFCMTYTWMQFLCSLLEDSTYKYKTIENFLF